MELMAAWSLVVIAFCMLMIMAAAVATLLRVRKFTVEAEKLVATVRLNIPPLMHDITQITDDLRSITHHVERHAAKLGEAFVAVNKTTQDVQILGSTIRERVGRPLLNLGRVMSGVTRGGVTFWRVLKSR
jgi:uncharacterized protein YoxC